MIAAQPQPKIEQSLAERSKRFSVAEYHTLFESGGLTTEYSLELIEGLLIEKMPIYPPHSFTTDVTRDFVTLLLPKGYFAKSQAPITLADSEPEPDGLIVRGNYRDFAATHPTATDTPLVIEVSDSSLRFDQQDKKRVYARAGIPIYWIINLIDRQVEIYSDPITDHEPPTYRQQTIYTEKDQFPVEIDGKTVGHIQTADILP